MRVKTKGWSKERRAKQAEIIRKTKPWQNATGPKTPRGKAASSLNALKHGLHSETVLMLKRVLRLHKDYVQSIK